MSGYETRLESSCGSTLGLSYSSVLFLCRRVWEMPGKELELLELKGRRNCTDFYNTDDWTVGADI